MPSITAAQLVGEVRIDGDEEAKRKLESVDKKVKETGEGFTGMLKNAVSFAAGQVIFTGVGDAIGFLKNQIADTIKVTEDHEQIQAQTNQVLQSTRDVSGMTAQRLHDLADSYSLVTRYSADTVQGGENLLLTFTNIGKQVFPDATQAILDVSQAMGQDLKSSAIQVGKALGDPITGMTALQRIGVTFSEEEKKAIKTMMDHKDIIGAQKIILKELQTEFGNSAYAAGQTFGGQVEILNHHLEDMKISIGESLMPILSNLLTNVVQPLIGKFYDWLFANGGLQDIQNIIKTIADFMTTTFLPAMGDLLNKYIIPLATQMYDLFIKSGWVHDAFKTIGDILGNLLPQVFNLATDIGNVIGWFQKSGPQGDILKTALIGIGVAVGLTKIKDLIGDLVTFATDTIPNQVIPAIAKMTGSEGLLGLKTAAADAAGSEGIGAIGPAMDAASETAGADFAAMKADILGMLGPIAILTIAAGQIWQKIAPKAPFPNAPTPLGPNGPNLPINPGGHTGPAWGKPPGANFPGFASGGIAPGGWVSMNEDGFEGVQFPGSGQPAYLPAGTRVIPNNQLSSSGNGGPMTLILQVDGYQLAHLVTQYQPGVIRNGVGLVGV